MIFSPRTRNAFTLIELLIVVAIIAILAAIAVPNFLEAQTRSKVSRSLADMRSIVTGLESYRVDNNSYPEGTDNPAKQPQDIRDFIAAHGLTGGHYTFASQGTSGEFVGSLTTPIAYMTRIPLDPFAEQVGGRLTYAYRNAKDTQNGWILTSFGPDADALQKIGGQVGVGSFNTTNPLSTATDSGSPARMGDVNERAVIRYIEEYNHPITSQVDSQYGGLENALADLEYDPTNGTISDGDVVRFRR
ncbi:type II secretion system protein GspG [bacterium]|nr:type II secretion system protein GspG [bacterium]